MKKALGIFFLSLRLFSVKAEDIFGDMLLAPAKVQIINMLPEDSLEELELPYIHVLGIGIGETRYIWESIERNGTLFLLSTYSKIICVNENLLFALDLQAGHDYIIRIEKKDGIFITNMIDTTVTRIYVIQNKILLSYNYFPFAPSYYFYSRHPYRGSPQRIYVQNWWPPANPGRGGGYRTPPSRPPQSQPPANPGSRPPSRPENPGRVEDNRPPSRPPQSQPPANNPGRNDNSRPPNRPENPDRVEDNRPPSRPPQSQPPANPGRNDNSRPPSRPENSDRGEASRPPQSQPPANPGRNDNSRPPSRPENSDRGEASRPPSQPPANPGRNDNSRPPSRGSGR